VAVLQPSPRVSTCAAPPAPAPRSSSSCPPGPSSN
jgi:hypothetical protein